MPETSVMEKKTREETENTSTEPALFEETPPKRKKWRLFLGLAVAAMALLFFSRGGAVIRGEGTLKANTFVRVTLTSPGILKEVLKKEGEWVKREEVLAHLENPELSNELLKKELRLEILTHDLTRLRESKAYLEKEAGRKTVLLENGAVSAGEMESTKLRLSQETQELAIREKEMESVQSEIAFLKAKLQSLELRSPLAGIIIKDPEDKLFNFLKEGEITYEIADPASFYLELAVPEKDVRKLKAGDPALIHFHAFPAKVYSGKIIRISARTEEEIEKVFKIKHVVLCEIKLEEMPPEPRYGMRAGVQIRLEERDGFKNLGSRINVMKEIPETRGNESQGNEASQS